MTTKLDDIDLTPFCEPEACRFAIDKPFVVGGFKCGTDSGILVWHPTDEPDSVTEKPLPKVLTIIETFSGIVCDKPWPESFPDCPTCGASGQTAVFKCLTCGGEGTQECDLGHHHDCPACAGNGYRKKASAGSGEKILMDCDVDKCQIVIDGFKLKRKLVRLLETIPGPLAYGARIMAEDCCQRGGVIKVKNASGVQAILIGSS